MSSAAEIFNRIRAREETTEAIMKNRSPEIILNHYKNISDVDHSLKHICTAIRVPGEAVTIALWCEENIKNHWQWTLDSRASTHLNGSYIYVYAFSNSDDRTLFTLTHI